MFDFRNSGRGSIIPGDLTCISVAYLWVWPSLPVTFLPLSDIEAFPFLLLVFSSDLEL